MNLNQSQLITILDAMYCLKSEVCVTLDDYNSIVEEVSKELLEKFNYETNLRKSELGYYIIDKSDFGRDHEEVEEERKLRKWKSENHVKDLFEVATYLNSLINDFMYENILYRQDGFELRSKFEGILQHVRQMLIEILPFDVAVEIIPRFWNNAVDVNFNFIDKNSNESFSEEEMKSILVKDDKMVLHNISKYLKTTGI